MTMLRKRGYVLARKLHTWLDRQIRRVRTPLGSLGLAALASGLCGFFLHPQGFVVFFGVLAVTALGLAWPWLSVCGLSGSLIFDRSRCREGEPVTARLTLRNWAPWSVWGVSIKTGAEEGIDEALTGLAYVPGWRTTSVTFQFMSGCRGQFPRRPPRAVCGFPFGLWEASRSLAAPESLLVWPRTFPVAALPEMAGGHIAEGLAPRDRPGNWGDPLGVRPYRRGDPLRRVHWPQTARYGELIVCEVQSNASPRVQVILDTRRSAHVGIGTNGSCEWAIRIAASLVEGWVGQGAEVELLFEGGVALDRGVASQARISALFDALARWQPPGERNRATLGDVLESRRVDDRFRVVITTDIGLVDSSAHAWKWSSANFVVLRAEGFCQQVSGVAHALLPIVPWVLIDGPDDVVASLRKLGKEVSLGCKGI